MSKRVLVMLVMLVMGIVVSAESTAYGVKCDIMTSASDDNTSIIYSFKDLSDIDTFWDKYYKAAKSRYYRTFVGDMYIDIAENEYSFAETTYVSDSHKFIMIAINGHLFIYLFELKQ